MSRRRTWATVVRVLRQLRHDHRTVALIVGLPTVLIGLLAWLLADLPGAFDHWGPLILGIFPLIIMFLVTSVATLRERTSGTLERVLAMPIGRADLIGGYVVAFGLVAVGQAAVVSGFAFWAFGLEIPGSGLLLATTAVVNAILGTALGLWASSLARTEFQAVQMMPLTLFPQLYLCGLLIPRDQMPEPLYWLSAIMPLSYSMEAVTAAVTSSDVTSTYLVNLAVTIGFAFAALVVGGLTLRRQTT